MLGVLWPTGERCDARAIACTSVDQRCELRCQTFVEKTELQIAEMHRDRVTVVRILGLPPQLERRGGAQARDDVLPPLERDARELRVKARRVGNRRIGIGEILLALCEDAIEELADRVDFGRGRRERYGLVKGAEGRLESGLGRRRRGQALTGRRLLRDAQLVLNLSKGDRRS